MITTSRAGIVVLKHSWVSLNNTDRFGDTCHSTYHK